MSWGGGMEEQRLQESGAWSWHGSVHTWLDTASRYSILTYSSSQKATLCWLCLCYSE